MLYHGAWGIVWETDDSKSARRLWKMTVNGRDGELQNFQKTHLRRGWTVMEIIFNLTHKRWDQVGHVQYHSGERIKYAQRSSSKKMVTCPWKGKEVTVCMFSGQASGGTWCELREPENRHFFSHNSWPDKDHFPAPDPIHVYQPFLSPSILFEVVFPGINKLLPEP